MATTSALVLALRDRRVPGPKLPDVATLTPRATPSLPLASAAYVLPTPLTPSNSLSATGARYLSISSAIDSLECVDLAVPNNAEIELFLNTLDSDDEPPIPPAKRAKLIRTAKLAPWQWAVQQDWQNRKILSHLRQVLPDQIWYPPKWMEEAITITSKTHILSPVASCYHNVDVDSILATAQLSEFVNQGPKYAQPLRKKVTEAINAQRTALSGKIFSRGKARTREDIGLLSHTGFAKYIFNITRITNAHSARAALFRILRGDGGAEASKAFFTLADQHARWLALHKGTDMYKQKIQEYLDKARPLFGPPTAAEHNLNDNDIIFAAADYPSDQDSV